MPILLRQIALAWLEALGYTTLHGLDIAVGILGVERQMREATA
jgi:hypothetical protein